MSRPQTPCYDYKFHEDCPNRKPGCHSTCPEWAEYEKKRDREYTRRRYENDAIGCRSGKITDQYCKNIIKKRKFGGKSYKA
jgi:hypothetical protein|nr:MAG TPA: hypothetical protein [Caudoviricetes sp.]